MKYNCLVVDDEPIAQQIIEKYISQIEILNHIGTSNNAFDAMNILHKEKVDILFLDIKMPAMTGLELIKTLNNAPKIILTTAFSEYAVESYEYGITDYLLKPIPFDRFLKAVNKIVMQKSNEIETKAEEPKAENKFIFFKADKKIHKFNYEDICYLEGFGNYVKVHTANASPLLVLDKLSELENKLPHQIFKRVHKSYIVNVTHIKNIIGNCININKAEIPISATYKNELQEWVSKGK